jgi:hypothetical protein
MPPVTTKSNSIFAHLYWANSELKRRITE